MSQTGEVLKKKTLSKDVTLSRKMRKPCGTVGPPSLHILMLHPDAFPEPLRSFEGSKEFVEPHDKSRDRNTTSRAVCLFARAQVEAAIWLAPDIP